METNRKKKWMIRLIVVGGCTIAGVLLLYIVVIILAWVQPVHTPTARAFVCGETPSGKKTGLETHELKAVPPDSEKELRKIFAQAPNWIEPDTLKSLERDYLNLLGMIRVYQEKREQYSYTDAYATLRQISRKYSSLQEELNSIWPKLPQLVKKHRNDLMNATNQEYERLHQWKEAVAKAGAFSLNVEFLTLYESNAKWLEAAHLSRAIGNWEGERYYLKKLGMQGDKIIAYRAVQRFTRSVWYSVMSIGPDFHLPKAEAWY